MNFKDAVISYNSYLERLDIIKDRLDLLFLYVFQEISESQEYGRWLLLASANTYLSAGELGSSLTDLYVSKIEVYHEGSLGIRISLNGEFLALSLEELENLIDKAIEEYRTEDFVNIEITYEMLDIYQDITNIDMLSLLGIPLYKSCFSWIQRLQSAKEGEYLFFSDLSGFRVCKDPVKYLRKDAKLVLCGVEDEDCDKIIEYPNCIYYYKMLHNNSSSLNTGLYTLLLQYISIGAAYRAKLEKLINPVRVIIDCKKLLGLEYEIYEKVSELRKYNISVKFMDSTLGRI